MSVTTVVRGLGDRRGPDISDPLLTHERARIARGRYELDAQGVSKTEVGGQGYYIGWLAPGTLVELADRKGRKRRGLVESCEIVLRRGDEQTFTADTNLTLEVL